MKILILANHFNRGGISRYCLNLAKALKKRGHVIFLGSRGGDWAPRLAQAGINHFLLPINTKSILSPNIFHCYCKLTRFVKRENIDILHCNTRVTQMLGNLCFMFFNMPYVSSFHGFYRKHIFRRFLKLAGNRTIAVSSAVKKHLIDDFKFRGDNISVIHNGINAEEFLFLKTNSANSGFTSDDFLIGMLGRISKEKGCFLAVRAAERVLSGPEHKNIHFLISGEGKLKTKLQTFINQRNLRGKVHLFNWEAEKFLPMLDLFIIPSQKEGFGYTILEAFAAGVPVIGYATGGIAEIIQDRQNGLLFRDYRPDSLAVSIREAVLDSELRQKLIRGAKRCLNFFSCAQMAQKTEGVYAQAIESAGR